MGNQIITLKLIEKSKCQTWEEREAICDKKRVTQGKKVDV
jgi:hypothetical protein